MARVDPLAELVTAHAASGPDRVAYAADDGDVTWRALDECSDRLAGTPHPAPEDASPFPPLGLVRPVVLVAGHVAHARHRERVVRPRRRERPVETVEVLDAKGDVVGKTFTTASCGTGCRGDYSVDVNYTVPKQQRGTIVVHDDDAAGTGTPPHSVRVSVTLAP